MFRQPADKNVYATYRWREERLDLPLLWGAI
jgi:hypothetical protein